MSHENKIIGCYYYPLKLSSECFDVILMSPQTLHVNFLKPIKKLVAGRNSHKNNIRSDPAQRFFFYIPLSTKNVIVKSMQVHIPACYQNDNHRQTMYTQSCLQAGDEDYSCFDCSTFCQHLPTHATLFCYREGN